MKREFIKRIVLETIQKKVSDTGSDKTVEIQLTPNDFLDSFSNLPTLFFSDIPEIVIELESDTQGKISLVSSFPIKTGDPLFSSIPDYYRIAYNPKAIPQQVSSGDPLFFYLSRSKGLYRAPMGKIEEIYPLKRSDQRFLILENLTNKRQETDSLAMKVGTTSSKLRPQIKGIKAQIEKTFAGIKGDTFIIGQQGNGYRLGDKITLKIIE